MSISFFLFILILFLTNKFFLQNKYFFDRTEFSKHKKFLHNKKIPVTGGIFLLIFLILFLKDLNFQSYFYLFLIFIIGFGSDRLKKFSPKLRLITQIILTLMFILDNNILINDVRISSFNFVLLNYELISVFFTIFCVLVLTNGTNFIDGVNLNTIGYFLSIFILILFLSNENNLNINFHFNIKIIIFLSFLYLLNYFNQIQLGDSGAYLLGFFSAFYIIQFVNDNRVVSPYFAVLLFWYPCFENLFSIFRKIYQKKNVSSADNLHLHHNIFLFLKLRDVQNTNNISGIILNLSNLIMLALSINYFNSTQHLILLIFINIIIYVVIYNILINKNLFKKFKKK